MSNDFDLKNYLVEEVKAARSRIDQEIISMNSNEALTVTYLGAIYVVFFQFKVSDPWFLRLLSVLPIGISIYGLLRYNAQRHVINLHEDYIKQIEDKFRVSGSDFVGLMAHYDSKKKSKLKYARWTLWGSLIVFTLIFSLSAFCYPEWLASIHKADSK